MRMIVSGCVFAELVIDRTEAILLGEENADKINLLFKHSIAKNRQKNFREEAQDEIFQQIL